LGRAKVVAALASRPVPLRTAGRNEAEIRQAMDLNAQTSTP